MENRLEEKYNLFLKKINEFKLDNKIKVNKKVFFKLFSLLEKYNMKKDLLDDFISQLKHIKNRNNTDKCPNCSSFLLLTGYMIGHEISTDYFTCLSCGKCFSKSKAEFKEIDSPEFVHAQE